MRSRRGIYLGVSTQHLSTVHLIITLKIGVISPQYHCVFDDIFSTVWSNGLFDQNLWENPVQIVDCHFSVEPDSNGQVRLFGDFTPIAPDTPVCDGFPSSESYCSIDTYIIKPY